MEPFACCCFAAASSTSRGVSGSYSDFVNAMNSENKEGKELSVGVTVLYTKFDTYAVGAREGVDS